jgi:hypothetical protein
VGSVFEHLSTDGGNFKPASMQNNYYVIVGLLLPNIERIIL